uniref:Hepatitis A virus cellular receptor 2 n=1 Tax=Pundamilia nyererei TaxID=303518 RepID=A0A3B4ERI2_9CICH
VVVFCFLHHNTCFTRVIGLVGHNVTLTCRYDTKTHGVLSFCWGKDRVPTSKCSNTILSSTGEAVSNRRSSRYQLLGRVTNGDLSLTILNAQTEDAGVYGCRIEIPGWFNDHKVNIELIIEEGNAPAVEQPVTQNYIISTAGTTGEQTPTNKYAAAHEKSTPSTVFCIILTIRSNFSLTEG